MAGDDLSDENLDLLEGVRSRLPSVLDLRVTSRTTYDGGTPLQLSGLNELRGELLQRQVLPSGLAIHACPQCRTSRLPISSELVHQPPRLTACAPHLPSSFRGLSLRRGRIPPRWGGVLAAGQRPRTLGQVVGPCNGRPRSCVVLDV